MLDFMQVALSAAWPDIAWPLAIALAWTAGELGYRWTGLPRISIYGLTGFILANSQSGFLPGANTAIAGLLANVAFGLILFEFGYRINLRWLYTNPWIGLSGVVEIIGTFIAVYLVAILFDMQTMPALLIASLAVSTSPAAIMRVINERRSSGQVTERLLHLSAFNCVAAVFAFKVVIGFWTFHSSGSVWQAILSSLAILLLSAGLGTLFGIVVPALLRTLGQSNQEATLAFAISVILLVAITYTFNLSPVLATLTFGFVARYRRVIFNQTQRNFGVLGDLLTVLLFLFVATTLEWGRIKSGAEVALGLIAARFAMKTLGVALFARLSGISWRKGFLTGIALTPISVFVILLLEQEHRLTTGLLGNPGINLLDELAPLAAATLFLEIIGPIVTHWALIWAKETPEKTPDALEKSTCR